MNPTPYKPNQTPFWTITITLALASFFIFASMYAVQPLFPVFVTDFNTSITLASFSLSFSIVGLIVGLIVLGFLSDRFGRTFFIKLSLICAFLPFLMIASTDSFTVILVMRFIQGIAFAGLPAAAIAYLSEEIHPAHTAVATALYIASNAFGGMTGRVLAGAVTEWISWQAYFYLLAGIGGVISIIVIAVLPKSRFFVPSTLSFTRDVKQMLVHIKNPVLLLVFGLGVIFQISFTGVWTYLPFHLQATPFSLSLGAISYFFFAYGFGVIGSPLSGWLAGHFGLYRIRLIGVVMLSVGLWLTLSPWIWLLAVGLSLVCLGFFTSHSLTATSIGELVTHHKGSAASLYLVSYYIGVVFGSSALSPLWNGLGWNGMMLVLGFLPITYMVVVQVLLKR